MITAITGLIGGLLYPLFSVIFVIIDLLQGVFYGLAGIGDIGFSRKINNSWDNFWGNGQTIGSTNDGGETSTGLIYYLLTSPLIKNLFMSILILALFLIIIFTAMAFIKNAYSAKQKTWQEIVGNAFKGLANFIFIPVCCLLGVWLSNILLLAINGATSTGGATQMSRKLFICCAYDANEYRNKTEVDDTDIADITLLVEKCDDVDVKFDPKHDKKDVEYFANIVDTVYAQTSKDYANITWWGSVERHYSLFNFNYLVLIVGGVFMLYVLISVAYAMIKRMFILLMLFVVSPAICAMYPIDEGSAVGNWKKEFIKYTISAYGAIAGMNLFFSILPIVENIQIISWGGAITNDIFQLLIMTSGLFVVKEFMGTLSGWIGGDNALATGESLKKSATGAVKKYATGTVKTTGAFLKATGKAKAAKDAWREEHLKSGQKHLSFGQWIQKQGVGLGSVGKDAFFGSLKGVDKSAFGGEAEKMFKARGEGKKAFDTEAEEKFKKDFEKKTKKETKESRKLFADTHTKIDDVKDKYGNPIPVQDQEYEYIKQMQKAGYSEDESFDKVSRLTGKTVKQLKEEYADIKEKKDEEKAKAKGTTSNKELANEIVAGLAPLFAATSSGSGSSTSTTATPTGGRSHVEDTAQERAENKLLKDIRDHLATLISLQTKGQSAELANMSAKQAVNSALGSGAMANNIRNMMDNGKEIDFGKMVVGNVRVDNMDALKADIEAYNASIKDKKLTEDVLNETSKQLVESLKKYVAGNKDAEIAIMKFKKAADMSADAVQKLIKEIQDLTKK